MSTIMKIIIGKSVYQYFLIYALTMITTLIICHFFYPDITFELSYFWEVMVFSLLAVLPGFVYYSPKELTRKQWIIRTILHTILLETALLFAANLIGMYRGICGGIVFAIIILIIDSIVRLLSYTKDGKTADEINVQLKERRKNEKDIK